MSSGPLVRPQGDDEERGVTLYSSADLCALVKAGEL